MNKRVVFVVGSVLALVAHGELAEHQWDVFGSFGRACGQIERKDGEMSFDGKEYRIRTTVETDANGVSVRKSVIRNVSDKTIHAYCLLDRFLMEGGEYEVYTQASSWENESRGSWQNLHTGISVRGSLICGSNGFAPMLAVWNVQAGRGRVYHLLSDGAWQIGAARVPGNGGQTATTVAIEMGVDSRHLNYALEPGESLALPTVVSYEFRNKTDLDCHKLHAFWNARHPAKRNPPTIYNSWLSRFDKMELPHLLRQVEKARRLGVEYFVLDAGWFGPKADWTSVRGDWEERADGALGGRMGEVAEAVRKAGMKFGFWIEAESASPTAKIVKEHPEYFTVLNGVYFLDFTRKDAFDYIVGTTCALLKKYGAEFMKFDFNQNADYDPTGKAFIAYNAAFRRYIREVRRRNPNVYIEGCASGGLMMNLGWAEDYDSLWPSDNQSPYHGMRIIKETMLRVPPRMLERWIVARTVENIQPNYAGVDSRLMACDDGCWFRMRSVEPSYLDAFTLGGPVGFSCDLTAFSEPDLKRLSDVLSERRKDASFWNRSVGRILCDTPSLVAFQYDDGTLDDVRVVVVSDNLRQSRTTVHPVLAAGVDYRVDGRIRTAGDLAANGLGVALSSFRGTVVRLTAVRDRRAEIRATPNLPIPAGAQCRYVSAKGGDDGADGKTPASAWRTLARLAKADLPSGSLVLLERGGVYRGTVVARAGVTYTAYGEGPKPCICGSPADGADPAKWRQTDNPKVWAYDIGHRDVGTIVFNGGDSHAVKVLIRTEKTTGRKTDLRTGRPFESYRDLCRDLDFWHDYYEKGTGLLYLCSETNPGRRFASIEFNVKCEGVSVGTKSDVTVDNLCIRHVGGHGVGAGTCRNLTVSNCEFAWIGGSIQMERGFGRDHPTRYGNAVEIWGGCDGFVVTNCLISQVYDAGVTHQFQVPGSFGAARFDQKNILYADNFIECCNYSFEFFLKAAKDNPSRMENVLIRHNVCLNAGSGFCEERPDVGGAAHVKGWGGPGRERAVNCRIRDNLFCGLKNKVLDLGAGFIVEQEGRE